MEKANTVLMSISKIYIFIRAKVFYLKQQPIKNIFFAVQREIGIHKEVGGIENSAWHENFQNSRNKKSRIEFWSHAER